MPMKLLTEELKRQLPALYSQEGKGEDALAIVKFFCPWGSGTWYASEANAVLESGEDVPFDQVKGRTVADVLFFGVAFITERELGYFTLNQLQEVSGPGGLKIERDLYWRPTPLRECR